MEQEVKVFNDCQIPTNGTKNLLFPVQELKVVNYYIAYLHTE